MRNPITRKNPPKSWGEKPKIRGFGSTENPFNAHIVDQLNLIEGVAVGKMGGGKFNSGVPDIMGLAWLDCLILENKFLQSLPKRDHTTCLSRKDYRPGQIDFLTRAYNAIQEMGEYMADGDTKDPIIGSLVGVNTSTKFIFGVSAQFIVDDRHIYKYQLAHCLEIAKTDQTPFFYFDCDDLDGPEPYASLGDLVRRISCRS